MKLTAEITAGRSREEIVQLIMRLAQVDEGQARIIYGQETGAAGYGDSIRTDENGDILTPTRRERRTLADALEDS